MYKMIILEEVNATLHRLGATRLAALRQIDYFEYIAKIENGPNVLIRIDPTFANNWLNHGRTGEDIFVTAYFATLHAAVDAEGRDVDLITGSPFIGRQYLPPNAPYPSSDPDSRIV